MELSRIFQGHGYDVRPGKAVSYGSTPDITGLLGIHCEVKRRENVNLSAALAQAAADAEKFKDGIPVVFHRGNRQSWRVTMALDNWLTLYAAAIGKNPEKEIDNVLSEKREKETFH